MLQQMVGKHKSNWNIQLFLELWAYQISTKNSTSFTSFQLVYGLEAVLHNQCEIHSLKLAIELLPNTFAEEECLLYLLRLDEHC